MSRTRDKTAELVGRVLSDRYRVDDVLAAGGMGTVFVGEHVLMQKRVAIKVLRPEVEGFATLVSRFEREAIAGARVDHPGVAAATDFGKLEDGSYFLVLEYVPGVTLRQLTRKGPLPPERAARIARQIAAALGACHRVGVLHRDVKPHNVIVDESAGDRVKLIDFGLARVPVASAPERRAEDDDGPTVRHLTLKGIVFGTVAYMAPETALGMDAVDHRSDLYALGIILYEMLAGKHPFDPTDPAELFLCQRTAPPPPLAERAPGASVPAALEAAMMRMLAKRPSDRFASAAEVTIALDAAIGGAMPAEATPLEGSYTLAPSALTSRPPAPEDAPPAPPSLDTELSLARRRFRSGRLRPLAAALIGAAALAVAIARAPAPAVATGPARAVGPLAIAAGRAALEAEAARARAAHAARDALQAAARGDDPRAATAALLALADADPSAFADGSIRAAAADVALRAAYERHPGADALFAALADGLGADGLDVLYRMVATRGGSRGAERAAALLARSEVRGRASPALRVALDLRQARCADKPGLFARAASEGDARALAYLEQLRSSRCNAAIGECCYRGHRGLEKAIAALKRR